MSLEQVKGRGTSATAHDAAGSFRVPNLPFKFADGTARTRDYAPDIGAYSSEVLSEVLGYSPDQIDVLSNIVRDQER